MSQTPKDALDYHQYPKPGKIEVNASKPVSTQLDLSLAYTPGVAVPCNEIKKDPSAAYKYTARGNLVAVITDGSAVLGLGNIGALAGKPVMEGKGVLFKRFADIDVFDIELDTQEPDEFIRTVKLMEPTFGGINLEDIGAPNCFYIEEKLREQMNIPVFHDDQHGTAIIAGAALINGLKIVKKDIEDVKVVFLGAGAASIACANLFIELGMKREHAYMVDRGGVIYKGRTEGLNPYKKLFAIETEKRTLADAMEGADVFVGCSVANVVSKEMVASMAPKPLVFAMANPDPEIRPEAVHEVRDDAIMATGRSDFPNQVNNVLGFPFIFRGALDVRATTINEAMKVAATHALAELAQDDVPDDVLHAYGKERLEFGPEYIIPKPFDNRVLYRVAPAVARAAMESGVAQQPIHDFRAYEQHLQQLLHPSREVMLRFISQAQSGEKKRIVFPEGDHEKVLRAAQVIVNEGIAFPILLGDPDVIHARMAELGLRFGENSYNIINTWEQPEHREEYIQQYQTIRARQGVTYASASQAISSRINYAMMMLRSGNADGCVSGLNKIYKDTIRPALQIIGLNDDVKRASGMYMVMDRTGKARFFADTTVHFNPTAEQLAQIAVFAADTVRNFGIEPRVAMLSFSNFGSAPHPDSIKVKQATAIAKSLRPDLMLDGEMRVNVATSPQDYLKDYPFMELTEEANVFIFPSLNAGNISFQMLEHLAGMEVIGPILVGLKYPVNVLDSRSNVNQIVNMTAITSVMASRNS